MTHRLLSFGTIRLVIGAVALACASIAYGQDSTPSSTEVEPSSTTSTPEPTQEFVTAEIDDAPTDLELWGFDLQLDTVVTAASKKSERVSHAPAIITVISGEEIRARGYRSLADVIRRVPGFYDLYDLVTHNVGVRGVNGGARASGSILKVMIDGHQVDFRPSTGNFFGEELIPMEVIDRVEVIRGPASALYGADAFLGVVNVVTKNPSDASGFKLTMRGVMIRQNPGGGGSLMFADEGKRVSVLLAASGLYLRRDGLGIDPNSTALRDSSSFPVLSGRSSRDFSQPMTLFAKIGVKDVIGGKLELRSSIQRLDSRAEFVEFGALSHDNRVALLNQNHQLQWTRRFTDSFQLTASGYFLHATSTPDERLNINARDFILIRRVGAQGGGGSLEAQVQILDSLSLTVGTRLSC
jgi:outer membrane receptor for ferrienterochelin and colicins